MSEPTSVAVVGGGIVGSAVAYHLAREDVDTTLFDRNDDGRATSAGAGIVAPATSSKTDSEPWFLFAVEAAAYYPTLVSTLEADGATEHGYTTCDLLSVALDETEVAQFERAKHRAERRAEEYGTPDRGSFEEVSVERARELFPPLSEAHRAMVYYDQARIDGQAFESALRNAGQTHGLVVEDMDVTDIRTNNGAVTGIITADETRRFDAVVVSGGAWSGTFATTLGLDIPVTPQRGQIIHLDVSTNTIDWPIVSSFRDKYLVPWLDGHVAVGATREDETGFAPQATLEGVHDVYTEALRIAGGTQDTRGLCGAEPRETSVGLRPVSQDGLPILGSVPGVENAYLATGHGPTGLTLGPYSGRVVAAIVRGVEPESDISAFDPGRFN